MIKQQFITNVLNSNPSISGLAVLADALDARAGECFDIARIAKSQGNAAVCVRFNDIGIDAQDTCDAIRAIVYEAAKSLAVPDDLLEIA